MNKPEDHQADCSPAPATVGDRQRLHVWITGRVQGVGYRYATQQKARQLGLTGWVRNLADGRVEAVFEGNPDDLEAIAQWCTQGPPAAIVSHLAQQIEPGQIESAQSTSGFTIR
jgi:acylphosphatase